MRISCDKALKNFSELSKKKWPKLSEADTRSKIIDQLFTKCLNWQESDFLREKHGSNGYVDYIFKIRGRNIFVVEAKKKGHYFNIPISYNFRRRYQIGGAISKDKKIKNALTQTQEYCVAHGARFGVITNGQQFIIFEAIKPGEKWEKGNCVIFYNLSDIQDNFIEFWNILSKDAVEKNSFLDIVARELEELSFKRPVDNVIIKNIKEPRNNLYRYITPIIDYAFQEITHPEKLDMLKQCYVYDEEFSGFDETIRKEFSFRMPKLYKTEELKKIVQDKETSGIFQKDFYRNIEKLGSGFGEPILLLLLGSIGSGKTTFIHRFFNVVLEEEKETHLWFYVDWRKGPTNTNEIRPYILKCIVNQFYTKYEGIATKLKTEFNQEDFSPNIKDIKRMFAILKALGYVLALVVDNVDQHKSSSPTFHENVYLEANSLTTDLRIITIMTLREESYYKSSLTGAFNAYYIQKYIISPPDFMKLILYRLDYILKKMKLPENKFRELLKTNVDFGPKKLKAIKSFLKIIKDSFSRPRAEVSEFMSRTAGGNMRWVLQLFGVFLTSGNTKINEMLGKYRQSGAYYIAHHQLLKSIMLGDHRYYSEERSYLMNIFDFNVEYSNDHFLNLKLLSYAEEHLTNITVHGRGFVEVNEIMKEATDLLISSKAVEDSLLRLAKHDLIMLDTRSRESLENASFFKITERGSYYLNKLIKKFVYLDAVWTDTPIANFDLVNKLRTLINSRILSARFKRTKMFLDYLEKMEDNEKTRHPEHQSSPIGKFRFTKRMISGFEKERKDIEKSLKRRHAFY